MTLDPRTRFHLNKEDKGQHAQLVAAPWFQKAMDLAMLQFVNNLPSGTDPHVAIANAHQLEGARDFVKLFMNFSEVPTKSNPVSSANLPGNVKN